MTDIDRAVKLSGASVDDVVNGYLTAQLWAQSDMDNEDDMLDARYDVDNVAPDYVERLTEELRDVIVAHPLAVRMYLTQRRFNACDGSASDHFGHDLYLTREHHGVGFWDRGLGELGEYLTRVADNAGSADMLFDDGTGTLTA